jgi:hypothetical protein
VNIAPTGWRLRLGNWLGFWFYRPPYAQLAVMRAVTGLILVYLLLVGSFDLINHYSTAGWADRAPLQAIDTRLWHLSLLDWLPGPLWLWLLHVVAVMAGVAFLLGVWPWASGAVSIAVLVTYGSRNPAVALGLDGLMILSLFYLALTPCGVALCVLPKLPDRSLRPAAFERETETFASTWGGFPLRLMQLHLCVLYFLSGLARMAPAWLSGGVLWGPRLVAGEGVPVGLATLQAYPFLVPLITYGLTLFELFYGALIWQPQLRYPVLMVSLVVHLAVGWLWSALPFNLLMLAWNLAFVRAEHVQRLLDELEPFLTLPWAEPDERG